MNHSETSNASHARRPSILLTEMIALTTVFALLNGCGTDTSQAELDSEKTITDSQVIVEELTVVEELTADTKPPESKTSSTTIAANKPLLSGKQVYDQACFACHSTGVSGAPIYGDATTWGPRIEQGIETIYDHSINGFSGQLGYMPPKGGFEALAIDEVLAAVDYMLEGI